MARLCFGLYREYRSTGLYRESRKKPSSVGWVNTNIFDSNRNMKKHLSLHFWPSERSQDKILFPIHSSEQNKSFKDASSLVFKLNNNNIQGKSLCFPPDMTAEDLSSSSCSDEEEEEAGATLNPSQGNKGNLWERSSEESLYLHSNKTSCPGSESNRSSSSSNNSCSASSNEDNSSSSNNSCSAISNDSCSAIHQNSYRLERAALVPDNPSGSTVDKEVKTHSPTVSKVSPEEKRCSLDRPGTRRRTLIREGSVLVPNLKLSKTFNEELQRIARRDPLHSMTIQEMNLLVGVKESCRLDHPTILPRLIDCIDYTNYRQVRDLHRLLLQWPTIPVEYAIQLLDYEYPDERVQEYAVRCLREGLDEELELYLNQLVQGIKHQNFFQNSLVKFLLERALKNQRLGHKFYWILKSEVRNSESTLKFPLILEAYLVGAPGHMRILEKQRDFLTKLKCLSNCLEMVDMKGHQLHRRQKIFQEKLVKFFSPLEQGFICPMEPTLRCGTLDIHNCKLMKSKKMPVKLVFNNYDDRLEAPRLGGRQICVMYKTGDDLRQDNLVLNMIKVMDTIWKEGGMDYKMISYQCVPTSHNEGLIEIVEEAETICRIQMEESSRNCSGDISAWKAKLTAAFQRELIYRWICRQNPDPDSLTGALENFSLSCAGYTVAMYVLGIGDRHNDNIMLQKSGKLFHIDFGHIIGNFKSKLGIKRERNPLILPSEFIYVIEQQGQGQFKVFRSNCEKAYKMLRECGSLIVSLLAMMVSTGLPDLQCGDDLHYVRQVLQLDDDIGEEAALQHFRNVFDLSVRESFSTTTNWFLHTFNQIT